MSPLISLVGRPDGGAGLRSHDNFAFSDEVGNESVRLIPGDGDTLTRVVAGRVIEFVRR